MYLLNAETTIDWDLLPTENAPALSDLDLIFISPVGTVTYTDSPIAAEDYIAPTATVSGKVTYRFTPQLEGFWRIRLVTGTTDSYNILSKVEMYVFDSTSTTTPYNEDIGKPMPYDIGYYLQGYVVAGELYGSFVANRTISISKDAPGSFAICEESPEFFVQTLDILHNGVSVGSVVFGIESFNGVITINSFQLIPGDKLQIKVADGQIDNRIRDIAINIVACSTIVPCTVM